MNPPRTGKMIRWIRTVVGLAILAAAQPGAMGAKPADRSADAGSEGSARVSVDWGKVELVSRTVPTTQILAHRFTLRGDPMHDPDFAALRALRTDDTRLQFWYPVARQAVAELKAPTASQTFWDFTYIDPLMEDFYQSTPHTRHHINMGTIPRWMFDVPEKDVPADPSATFYAYAEGMSGDRLKDRSGRQFAEYQVRLFQWYTQGGFTDELGRVHHSGHRYKIDYWGILNEPDFDNHLDVQQYTRIWDAVATAIRRIDPNVAFFGPEIFGSEVAWAKYFLDPKNHAPDAPPVRYFSFHNYADGTNDPATWHHDFFTGAPRWETSGVSVGFLADRLQQVIKLRDALSPGTELVLDEFGVFARVKPEEEPCRADEPYDAFHPLYWNANGANWVGTFMVAQRYGVRLISMSQMDAYPTQCPSISMMDYQTRRPNAHYWSLYLVSHNFGPGDRLVATECSSADVLAQASITPAGKKLLLVNTQDHAVTVALGSAFPRSGESRRVRIDIVDQQSGEQPPRTGTVEGGQLALPPFAVAVVSFANGEG